MLIYVAPIHTAFIQRDLDMLCKHTEVKLLTFTNKPILLPFYFILQFVQLLLFLPRTDQYICFFGGYHTVIPVVLGKILKKRVIIQCGGTDAMNLPNIGYGNFRKRWLKAATTFSFKNCSLIVPVSEALVASDYQFDDNAPRKQGLKNLIPSLTTPIEVIHNGFDPIFWTDSTPQKKPFHFVTVATRISTPSRARVKGIDLILDIAPRYPNFTFTIVGDENFVCPQPNIRVLPRLPKESLRSVYQNAEYYLQLSASEGFPNALAESMLCGCIPIGSRVGEIPNIIGDTGFILEKRDLSLLCQILDSLPPSDFPNHRQKARNRIVSLFDHSKREQKILKILQLDFSSAPL